MSKILFNGTHFILDVTMMAMIWLQAQTVFSTLSRHPKRRTVADMQRSERWLTSKQLHEYPVNLSHWHCQQRWLQHKQEKTTYGRQNLYKGQRKLLCISLQKRSIYNSLCLYTRIPIAAKEKWSFTFHKFLCVFTTARATESCSH